MGSVTEAGVKRYVEAESRHPLMRRTFKYRIYPTRMQAEALHGQLDEACRLYNAALDERRSAWRMKHVAVRYLDQANQLKAIRAAGHVGVANFSACQDVLRRLDKVFTAFFGRLKAGEKAGYPRFRSRLRYDSLTYPSWGDGCSLRASGHLYLQGVGELKGKVAPAVAGRRHDQDGYGQTRSWRLVRVLQSRIGRARTIGCV